MVSPDFFTPVTPTNAADAARHLARVLDAHAEWFCVETEAAIAMSLVRAECDVRPAHNGVVFSFWGTHGLAVRRVIAWSHEGNQLHLRVAQRGGDARKSRDDADVRRRRVTSHSTLRSTLRSTLTLTARTSIADDAACIEHARLEACARCAHAALLTLDARWKIEKFGLSRSASRTRPGRFARVILTRGRARILLTADLSNATKGENGTSGDTARPVTDALLTSALLWFARLAVREPPRHGTDGEPKISSAPRTTTATRQLWLVVTEAQSHEVALRCACLRETTRDLMRVWRTNDDFTALTAEPFPTLEDALKPRPSPFVRTSSVERASRPPSALAERIRLMAPEAIDVIYARHGETLRFHGLAFARIRRLMNRDHVWLGAWAPRAGKRTTRDHLPIDDADEAATTQAWRAVRHIIDELTLARRADAPDRRHVLFHLAPESWLESILRRDITTLDPGLRLAPLHAQFRDAHTTAVARPVDLLAIRRDGRLVVIELKVAEDDALPLQAADYWRRIETLRRTNHIAQLFGDTHVADLAPLVYVVAPMLCFARSFDALASHISPAIELYRFDINEDWRAGVRVMRRSLVGDKR